MVIDIFRVAKNEYLKWIKNPKLIIILVMLIFCYDFVCKEQIIAANKMQVQLQIFEGFIAISNTQLLLMIIPIVYVGIMGDFPRVDGNAMFYIFRVGKTNWLIGQILFAIMAAFTYLTIIFSFSVLVLINKAYLNNLYSNVTTRYYLFAPNEIEGKVVNLITGRLYNNLPPYQATVNIFCLMLLFLILISFVLIICFLYNSKSLGVIVSTSILCLGNMIVYLENFIRWLFPTAHAILEIHFDEIYNYKIMDLKLSYLYYLIIIIILFVWAYLLIEKYDFSKIEELEE